MSRKSTTKEPARHKIGDILWYSHDNPQIPVFAVRITKAWRYGLHGVRRYSAELVDQPPPRSDDHTKDVLHWWRNDPFEFGETCALDNRMHFTEREALEVKMRRGQREVRDAKERLRVLKAAVKFTTDRLSEIKKRKHP